MELSSSKIKICLPGTYIELNTDDKLLIGPEQWVKHGLISQTDYKYLITYSGLHSTKIMDHSTGSFNIKDLMLLELNIKKKVLSFIKDSVFNGTVPSMIQCNNIKDQVIEIVNNIFHYSKHLIPTHTLQPQIDIICSTPEVAVTWLDTPIITSPVIRCEGYFAINQIALM